LLHGYYKENKKLFQCKTRCMNKSEFLKYKIMITKIKLEKKKSLKWPPHYSKNSKWNTVFPNTSWTSWLLCILKFLSTPKWAQKNIKRGVGLDEEKQKQIRNISCWQRVSFVGKNQKTIDVLNLRLLLLKLDSSNLKNIIPVTKRNTSQLDCQWYKARI
jgi:hypothetical protein